MLEIINSLLKHGMALLHEREVKKTKFFDEVAKPINEVFQTFCAEHIATFQEIRVSLQDRNKSVQDMLAELQSKCVMQSSSWEFIDGLKNFSPSTKADLDVYYTRYIEELSYCLLKIDRLANIYDPPPPMMIVYYSGLQSELINNLGKLGIKTGTEGDQARLKALQATDVIIGDFQKYRSRVDLAYLNLRQFCKV